MAFLLQPASFKFAFLGQLSGGSYTNSLALLVNIASCPSRTRSAAQIYTTWPPRWMTPIVSRKRACAKDQEALDEQIKGIRNDQESLEEDLVSCYRHEEREFGFF